MVKELLFDRFINILQEPKVPRVSKAKTAGAGAAGAAVKTGKAKVSADTEVSVAPVAKTRKPKKATTGDASDANAANTGCAATANLDATIKITKKLKTNMIEVIAYIKNDKNKKKKLWEVKTEKTDKCINKDQETIELVKQIIAYNSNSIYYITLNNKALAEEYNKAHYTYNDVIKTSNNTGETIEDIMKGIVNSQDTGKLKDINNVYKYYDLIQLNSRFIFV
jgi:hypothetical protein